MLKARRYRTERTEIYGDREFARMPRIRKEIKKGQRRRMRRSARFWIWEETSPNFGKKQAPTWTTYAPFGCISWEMITQNEKAPQT